MDCDIIRVKKLLLLHRTAPGHDIHTVIGSMIGCALQEQAIPSNDLYDRDFDRSICMYT
jgi:hypothetical protein